MKKIIKYLILSLMVVALVGCVETETSPEEAVSDSEFVEYGVAGNITEISQNESSDTIGILVKGDEDNGATYTQAWVTVNKDTKIYAEYSVEMDQLEVDMYVNVFFEGPVAESFPVQGTARQINIVEKEEGLETDSEE